MEYFIHYDKRNQTGLIRLIDKTRSLHDEKNDEYTSKLKDISLKDENNYVRRKFCYKKFIK